jgi:hypothetical protein
MDHIDSVATYLRLYADELGARILAQFPPLHQLGDQVHPGIARLRRRPFPAQQLAIMGIVRQWERSNAAAAIAECGTGKTLISLGAICCHADQRPYTALTMCDCDHKVTIWPVYGSSSQQRAGLCSAYASLSPARYLAESASVSFADGGTEIMKLDVERAP